MPQQLSLFEDPSPAGAAPVWDTLDEQQRAEIVHKLAELIAKAIAVLEDQPHE